VYQKCRHPFGRLHFCYPEVDSNDLNARLRGSLVRRVGSRRHLYFHFPKRNENANESRLRCTTNVLDFEKPSSLVDRGTRLPPRSCRHRRRLGARPFQCACCLDCKSIRTICVLMVIRTYVFIKIIQRKNGRFSKSMDYLLYD